MVRSYSNILPIAMDSDAKENPPPSPRSTSLPSLDEWVCKHGCEEDIFFYLLKCQEDSMFEITLRPTTGNSNSGILAESFKSHDMDPCPSEDDLIVL